MSFKIKDLLRIVKEAQQRERNLEVLNNRISGYVNEGGHLIYEPNKCRQEFKAAKEDYDRWVDSDLSILFGEPTEHPKLKCETDDATHATNVQIMKLLGEYLDENPQIRFGQALMNLDIVRIVTTSRIDPWNLAGHELETQVLDPYYDSSDVILERMKGRLGYE